MSPKNYPFFLASYYPPGYSLEQGLDSVGPGWKPLVEEIFNNKPDNVLVVQVKEKFGALRVYHEPYNEAFQELINAQEKKSLSMCEVCGKKGKLYGTGYLRTLCREHIETRY